MQNIKYLITFDVKNLGSYELPSFRRNSMLLLEILATTNILDSVFQRGFF